jgi:hypothetical protein
MTDRGIVNFGNATNGTVFTAGNSGYYFVGWGRSSKSPNTTRVWFLNTNNSNSWVMPMGYVNESGNANASNDCPMGSLNNYASTGGSSYAYMYYQGRVNGGQSLLAGRGNTTSNNYGGYYGRNWTWNS